MLLLVLLSFTRLYLCWKAICSLRRSRMAMLHFPFLWPHLETVRTRRIFSGLWLKPCHLQTVLRHCRLSFVSSFPPPWLKDPPLGINQRWCQTHVFVLIRPTITDTEVADIWQGGKWYKMASGFLEESFRFSFFGLSTCLKVTRSPTQ